MVENQGLAEVKLRQRQVTGGVNRGKIDDQVLYRMLAEEGRSQKEAAAYFHVTEPAISKRVKALKLNLARHVGLERAKEVADRGLDVFSQLQRINGAIQEELTWAIQEARRSGADRKGLQQIIIDLSGEVRQQLRFQLDLLRSLYDLKGMADFQQEVLNVIGEVAPDVRDAIVRRLQEKRAVRSALDFPRPGW